MRQSGWLAQTPKRMQQAFRELARWHSIERGGHLILAGDETGDLIGLASGTVAFTVSLGLPSTPIMHVSKAVIWMGYRPLVLGAPRIVTAQARSNVQFASFSKTGIRALLNKNPEWWEHFVVLQANYGDITAQVAADLLIPDSKRRLAAVLLRFAGFLGSGDVNADHIQIPLTQNELAASANMSRNSAVDILREFKKLGWIETTYGEVTVCSKQGLSRLLATE